MWDIQTVVHQFSLLSLVPNYHTICLEHCNCLVFLFIFIFCAGIVTDALKSLDCSKRIYFSVFERVSCFFYLTNYPQAVHFYHGYLFKYIEYCFEVRTKRVPFKSAFKLSLNLSRWCKKVCWNSTILTTCPLWYSTTKVKKREKKHDIEKRKETSCILSAVFSFNCSFSSFFVPSGNLIWNRLYNLSISNTTNHRILPILATKSAGNVSKLIKLLFVHSY